MSEDHKALKAAAKPADVQVAESHSLRTPLPEDRKRPWMRFAGMVESGHTDASQTVDELVYRSKD
jgi:hypothetical protein